MPLVIWNNDLCLCNFFNYLLLTDFFYHRSLSPISLNLFTRLQLTGSINGRMRLLDPLCYGCQTVSLLIWQFNNLALRSPRKVSNKLPQNLRYYLLKLLHAKVLLATFIHNILFEPKSKRDILVGIDVLDLLPS